jgi:hypothetical protein
LLDMEIVKDSTKLGDGRRGWWVDEEEWGLLCFVALMNVWVYFCCHGGCLCQGLQGAGVVYSWYSRLFILQIHERSF